jgi:uncharacterized membrane protein
MKDMNNDKSKLKIFFNKLDKLTKKSVHLKDEIIELNEDIIHLRNEIEAIKNKGYRDKIIENNQIEIEKGIQNKKVSTNWEKFIGENIISKIGVVITIVGVFIGIRHSIDYELITPLIRIIIGYIFGFLLLSLGVYFLKKYKNYSAVLISGAMAINFFSTYASYSFYNLISQLTCFVILALVTIITVLFSTKYNKQFMAIIGLVGAYVIPFLLSSGEENVAVYFSYMVIINVGILFVAFLKYWKKLYYISFITTWFIYCFWYLSKYQLNEHFHLSLIISLTFFLIFYTISLAYKIVKKEKFSVNDVIFLLGNSFVFYGFGYAMLNESALYKNSLGLFTLFNALLHLIASVLIYKRKLVDKNLFYLISGLVLVFVTIAVPVQLSGNWVTLIWVSEAVLLFWIGRYKNLNYYEKLSYWMMILSFISLVDDWWSEYYGLNMISPENRLTPFYNAIFLTSIIFVIFFGFIYKLSLNKEGITSFFSKNKFFKLMSIVIPCVFIVSLYETFQLEIANYWNQLYQDNQKYELIIQNLKSISVINYSVFFFAILSAVSLMKLKSYSLKMIILSINTIVILFFLILGLSVLNQLNHMEHELVLFANLNAVNLRYSSLALVSLLLFITIKLVCWDIKNNILVKLYDFVLLVTILWILSDELIYWLTILDDMQSDKLGLSILWGIFSLVTIVLGILKNKKHLRLGAFVLFGITLLKLLFYDISHFNNVSKTIVFISLGIFLLIISFTYHKYKHLIRE